MLPDWVHGYIGLEFEDKGRGPKHDCWSLVRAIYAEQFGIALPSYTEEYPTTTDREEIAALMRRESLGWAEMPLAEAQPGDVVLFRMQGQVCHAGLVIDPPVFLHCVKGIGSALERWDAAIWSRRVWGVLRHPARLDESAERARLDESAERARLDDSSKRALLRRPEFVAGMSA